MTLFDDDFIGLDNDIVAPDGDGSEPCDVALLQLLRANAVALFQRGSNVGVSFAVNHGAKLRGNFAGKRPFVAINFASHTLIPWICVKGQDKIELNLASRVSMQPSANTATIAYRLELVGLASKSGGIGATFVGSADVFKEISLSLEHAPVDVETVTHLALWLRSIPGDEYATALDVLARDPARLKDAGIAANVLGAVSAYRAGGPTNADPGVQAIQDTDSQSWFGIAFVVNDYEVAASSTLSSFRDIDTASIRYVSYMQSLGMTVRATVDPGESVPDRRLYLPHRIVESGADILIPAALLEQYKRPNCLWIGPSGTPFKDAAIEAEDYNPEGYHDRYTRIRDLDGDGKILIDAEIEPAKLNPLVQVLMNFVPIALGGQVRTDGTLEGLRDVATLASWTFNVEILAFNVAGSGSWDVIGSASITEQLTHLPTDPGGPWSLLRNEYLKERYVARDVTGEFISASSFANFEGQCEERDLEIVSLRRFRVPVSYDPLVPKAVRVRVTATMSTSGILYQQDLDSQQGILNPFKGSLWIVLVGATIWEGIE